MDKLLVSVIIPFTAERVQLLKRALKSVNNQTYPGIEVILVKDGPGPDLSWIIQKDIITHPVRIINMQTRVGPSASRNSGAREASGDFLAFLDSDDEWFPEKLELQMRCFQNESVGVVGGEYFMMDDRTGKVARIHGHILRGWVFKDLALTTAGIQTSFLMVRRKYFEQVGGFNEQLLYAEEKDLELRLAKICEFDWVEQPLGIQHGNFGLSQLQTESVKEIKRVNAFLETWQEEIRSLFGEKGVEEMRRVFYAGARRQQLLSVSSIKKRLNIFRDITIDEWKVLRFTDILKIALFVVFGEQILKIWKGIRWKKIM